jgi:hypothetical protein
MPASKKSDRRVEIILECLRAGMPVKRACEFARIDKQTFYNWYNNDPAFRLEADYSKSHAIRALISGVAKKDPWKLLKNLDSEHFKDEIPVNQVNVQINNYDKFLEGLDDEQLRDEIRRVFPEPEGEAGKNTETPEEKKPV